MPKSKNTTTKSRLAGQLQRAKAEIKRLRRERRGCRCTPMSAEKREQMIEEICSLVSEVPPADFDMAKLRAAGLLGENGAEFDLRSTDANDNDSGLKP